MVNVAQLVRVLVCGTKGREFESRLSPSIERVVYFVTILSFTGFCCCGNVEPVIDYTPEKSIMTEDTSECGYNTTQHKIDINQAPFDNSTIEGCQENIDTYYNKMPYIPWAYGCSTFSMVQYILHDPILKHSIQNGDFTNFKLKVPREIKEYEEYKDDDYDTCCLNEMILEPKNVYQCLYNCHVAFLRMLKTTWDDIDKNYENMRQYKGQLWYKIQYLNYLAHFISGSFRKGWVKEKLETIGYLYKLVGYKGNKKCYEADSFFEYFIKNPFNCLVCTNGNDSHSFNVFCSKNDPNNVHIADGWEQFWWNVNNKKTLGDTIDRKIFENKIKKQNTATITCFDCEKEKGEILKINQQYGRSRILEHQIPLMSTDNSIVKEQLRIYNQFLDGILEEVNSKIETLNHGIKIGKINKQLKEEIVRLCGYYSLCEVINDWRGVTCDNKHEGYEQCRKYNNDVDKHNSKVSKDDEKMFCKVMFVFVKHLDYSNLVVSDNSANSQFGHKQDVLKFDFNKMGITEEQKSKIIPIFGDEWGKYKLFIK